MTQQDDVERFQGHKISVSPKKMDKCPTARELIAVKLRGGCVR